MSALKVPQCLMSDVCLACDGCCRFASAESSWRPKAERGYKATSIGTDHYLLTRRIDGHVACVCLEDDNKCNVYDARPFECQLYPFLLVKKDKQIHLGVHLSCPFVLSDRHCDAFNKSIEEMSAFFMTEKAKVFLGKNKNLANAYSDYLDEIEVLFAL